MALIDTSNMTPANKARTEAALDNRFSLDGKVMSYREYIAGLPLNPSKEIFDGMCDYSRSRFNRMTSNAEQDAYMKRLRAKRYYAVGDISVPKLIFDAVVGAEPTDHTTDAREAREKANAALGARLLAGVA